MTKININKNIQFIDTWDYIDDLKHQWNRVWENTIRKYAEYRDREVEELKEEIRQLNAIRTKQR